MILPRRKRSPPTRRHVALLLGAAILAQGIERVRADPMSCAQATLDAARALAERAAAFLRERGEAEALPRFNARTGGFAAGDLYVFVFDLEGRLRASGAWPDAADARQHDDRAGTIYARMRHLALTEGRGWIDYSWYNPCTRAMEPKASYIIRVGSLIVGVGAYKRPGS